MQTTAMGTVANSLPKNEIILLTLLISDWYIPYTDLLKNPEYYPKLFEYLLAQGKVCYYVHKHSLYPLPK